MRWTRWTSITLVGLAAVGAIAAISCTTYKQEAAAPAAMSAADKVKRGEYLTTIGQCNDCHTPGAFYGAPDMTRKLSGSEIGWVGPWGVSYARNLTPAPGTNVSKWTEDEIVQTLRTGMRPDSTMLLPPMPWPNIAAMSDDDIHAVAAYLKSLTPVEHTVPTNVAPGAKAAGSLIAIPPPNAWDAQNLPKAPPAGK